MPIGYRTLTVNLDTYDLLEKIREKMARQETSYRLGMGRVIEYIAKKQLQEMS